jgi:transposase
MVISWLQHFYVTGYKELGYVKIRLVDSTSAQYLFKGGRNMIFVGIDVASDKHDFFITSSNGELYSKRSITINNNFLGYKKLHKSITEFCEATNDYIVRIGLESTGFYHLNITKFLLDNNFEVMIINPILTNMFKKSKKVHSPKTDNIDS